MYFILVLQLYEFKPLILGHTHAIMLYYLIYISQSSGLQSHESLQLILQESREWNIHHHLTGMLLYVEGKITSPINNTPDPQPGGRFMQVLEGTEADVLEVFERIRTDKRHTGLMVVKKGQLEERNFSTWDMGFQRITNQTAEDGFINLDELFTGDQAAQQDKLHLQFLKSFYQAVHSKK